MWTDFFVAAAGASAALAGLVFVALSVNIQRILQYAQLPARAAATLGTLVLILICSMAALIPQRTASLGLEILLFGIGGWLLEVLSAWRSATNGAKAGRPAREAALETLLGQIQVLPFIAGGTLLLNSRERGLYWVAAGIVATFVFSMVNAWVLLVEILR